MSVGVAWPPGTEAPAFPVPPDAPWPGLLIFPPCPLDHEKSVHAVALSRAAELCAAAT
jgi:hypothetical protein